MLGVLSPMLRITKISRRRVRQFRQEFHGQHRIIVLNPQPPNNNPRLPVRKRKMRSVVAHLLGVRRIRTKRVQPYPQRRRLTIIPGLPILLPPVPSVAPERILQPPARRPPAMVPVLAPARWSWRVRGRL